MRTNPLGWPAWAWRLLLALALLTTAASVTASLSNFARSAGLLRDIGPIGMTLVQPVGTPVGWSEVKDLWPVGPARAAGLVQGDLVRIDRPLGYSWRADQPIPITVERGGEHFSRTLVIPPLVQDTGSLNLFVLAGIGSLVATGFGALLLLRGRGNRAAALLGVILLLLAASGGRILPWAPSVAVLQFWVAILLPSYALVSFLWPFFALEVSGGARSRGQARFVVGGALVFAVLSATAELGRSVPFPIPVFGAGLWIAVIAANQLFGYAVIASNYRHNDPATRNRIKIVVMAFVCYAVAEALNVGTEIQLNSGIHPAQLVPLRIGLTAMSLVGLALLAYAVLRQRLFDLNFAVNRTLVYGAVSFILLATFGLAEWGAERLMPEAWHEGSAFFSAGVALALFLSFHRLRDWVEKHVERLLFSSWHRNEAALRRFASSAAHFEQSPALYRAFVEEVTRFAQGAGAAFYLRAAPSGYKRCAGKLPGARAAYVEDDRAFALMRAERRPITTRETPTPLAGVLALPMLDHGKLAGFVLLDRKPDGTDYRPDEVEVLGWAAHQVGLDLQAMHAGELEAEVAGLGAQVAALKAQLAAAGTRRKRATAA
jgi:hypothetical protein